MRADDQVPAVTYAHDDPVVVIIGSGAGGGTLAHELCAQGVGVVLIEAGPRFAPQDFINDEWAAYEQLTWRDRRTSSGSSPAVRLFPDTPTWVCKAVGGSTVHWGAVSMRLQAHELRARTVYGAVPGTSLIDWPLDLAELAPYYDRAERNMGVAGTQGLPPLPANNNFKLLAAGARRVGYRAVSLGTLAINARPYDGRNACDHIGFCFQGCKSGAKWSTLYVEIPKAEATGRLELRAECMALRIEHDDGGRASAVVYADKAGRHHRQRARAVCLAGNAIETPRLLLNSASARFPEGLGNDHGQVGRHYMRHMSGFLWAEFERPVHMSRGTPVCGLINDECHNDPARGFVGGIYMMTEALGLPYFAAFSQPFGWGRAVSRDIERYRYLTGCWFCGEDMPQSDNRVSLDPSERDVFGLPVPHLHVDDHANEFAMKNYGFKRVRALYAAAGARRMLEQQPLPSSHNIGTARMSADPREGVCNRWGQVHEVANLFISDGSAFPTAGAANPTLTIVALAIRQADHLAAALRAGSL